MKFNRQEIKKRVKELKAFLPYNVRNKIIDLHPEYNTLEGKNLIQNVLNCKSADYRIMEILEKIVTENQQSI